MDFHKTIKAFLASLPIKHMNGQQKFLAVVAHCVQGDTSQEITLAKVRTQWPQSTLKSTYSRTYYDRADEAGWISPNEGGSLAVTAEGLAHLAALVEVSDAKSESSTAIGLHIFDKKQTHSFDKFIRGVFVQAQHRVQIADSYVDERIFDTVLDVIQPSIEIKLIYKAKQGTYDARAARFITQYSSFTAKHYAELHDRFILVDGKGYIIGPSLKDAAAKSPALVVALNAADSKELEKFFQVLWPRAV